MASPTQWTWVWVDSGSWLWTGRPSSSWGRKESDTTERLNWTLFDAVLHEQERSMTPVRPLRYTVVDLLPGCIDPFINILWIQYIILWHYLKHNYCLVRSFVILLLSCMKQRRTPCANKKFSWKSRWICLNVNSSFVWIIILVASMEEKILLLQCKIDAQSSRIIYKEEQAIIG